MKDILKYTTRLYDAQAAVRAAARVVETAEEALLREGLALSVKDGFSVNIDYLDPSFEWYTRRLPFQQVVVTGRTFVPAAYDIVELNRDIEGLVAAKITWAPSLNRLYPIIMLLRKDREAPPP